jgi:hypothetical protein
MAVPFCLIIKTKEHGNNFSEPPPELIEGQPEWEVEEILDFRQYRHKLPTSFLGNHYLGSIIFPNESASFVKAAVGLGCFIDEQRPKRGLTLVQEFLSASRNLSSMLVVYVVKRTKH